jgi:hypothetical protein
MAEALAIAVDQCPLSSVRYELSKLRGKGLVEKLPYSRRYRLLRWDIGSARCSSNCSIKSMHRSPPASFIPIEAIELCLIN